MILVVGSSFVRHEDYPTWLPLLKTTEEVMEITPPGAGGDYIARRAIKAILQHKPSTVIIQWTDWSKYSHMYSAPLYPEVLHYLNSKPADFQKLWKNGLIHSSDDPEDENVQLPRSIRWKNGVWLKEYLDSITPEVREKMVVNCIEYNIFNNIIPVQNICEKYKIKLLMFQGFKPFRWFREFKNNWISLTDKYLCNLTQQYDQYIDMYKFIGWPLYKCGNGFTMSELVKDKGYVGENGFTPNEQGCELIATYINERL